MIRLLVTLAVLASLVGCTSTKDAVAVGDEFQFVAPGGKTTITYDDPAERGAVRGISGDSLLRPGSTVGLDDYAGRVVVLNVWGSWCGPCRTEAPDLQFVHEQLAASGGAVLGIDVRDSPDAAADFVASRGLTYDSVVDYPGRTLAQLRNYPRNAVPSTIVLDKQHRVAAVYLLSIRVPEIMPLLQRLESETP